MKVQIAFGAWLPVAVAQLWIVRPLPYHAMKTKIRVWVCIACFVAPISVFAQGQLYVVGYDIQNAVTSGSFVQWDHTYYGSITPTGTITVTLPPGDVTTATLATYSGGGGTLNDGSVGSSPNDTELFATAANPVITLYLDNTYTIQSLNLESFSLYNAIPGNIRRVTVTIDGSSVTLNTLRTQDDADNLYSSVLNIGSSSLAGVAGNQITLSGFTTTGSYSPVFCLGEIAVTGSPVPEPSALSLLGIGTILGWWCFAKRPNKSPEPTAVGACSSAIAVRVASRRWLSFLR